MPQKILPCQLKGEANVPQHPALPRLCNPRSSKELLHHLRGRGVGANERILHRGRPGLLHGPRVARGGGGAEAADLNLSVHSTHPNLRGGSLHPLSHRSQGNPRARPAHSLGSPILARLLVRLGRGIQLHQAGARRVPRLLQLLPERLNFRRSVRVKRGQARLCV